MHTPECIEDIEFYLNTNVVIVDKPLNGDKSPRNEVTVFRDFYIANKDKIKIGETVTGR